MKKPPSPPPPLPALAFPLLPPLIPLLLSDPPHLQAQGCSPAELSLRGSAAPPSGQSRDRRGVSHTRKTRVLLCLLEETRRCPPTWPGPSASFCRPQPRVWLLWVDPGITTSATSVSPNNPNYQASSSPQRPDDRTNVLNSRIPSPFTARAPECRQPEDASVLCSPGREGPRVAQLSSVAQSCLTFGGLQHTRLPYPSPTPGAYSNSCPLSR